MELTPRDKRILQIAGAAVLLLLLVYFLVLRPDGEQLALPGGPTGTTTGVPGESPSATPSPTPRETLPPVSLAGSRVPFSIPPGLEPAGGSVGPPTTTPAGTGTTIPRVTTSTVPPTTTFYPTFSTTTTTTAPPPNGGGGSEGPPNKIVIGGHNVTLVSVPSSGRVNVRVDGSVWTVQPGATFDDNFKLVKIDGKCATFLFGDQGFELCAR